MNTNKMNAMELNLNEMAMVNGAGDVGAGICKGAYAGGAAGLTIGGITLGFPGATFGMLIGAVGGGIVRGVIAAVTD